MKYMLVMEDVEEEYKNEIKDYIDSEISEIAALDEVYVGDGEMPETATLQIILDAADEEEALENELKNYIDFELTRAKESGEFDGAPGAKGDKGDTGAQGPKGNDGYTPVRGTDYWTAADRAEIKSYVDNAILNGVW